MAIEFVEKEAKVRVVALLITTGRWHRIAPTSQLSTD